MLTIRGVVCRGTIALYLGAFYEDYISNIIAVSTTSGGQGLTTTHYTYEPADSPAMLFPDTATGNAALCNFIAYSKLIPGPTTTAQDANNQNKVINATFADNTLSQALGNISVPTLIITGALDILLPIANSEYLLENMNNSSLLVAESAGHGALFQDEEILLPEVLDFLDYYDDYPEDANDYADNAFFSWAPMLKRYPFKSAVKFRYEHWQVWCGDLGIEDWWCLECLV